MPFVDPPIEPIHFEAPRAVEIREPGNVREIHSTVSGRMFVYVETKTEADAILSAWRVIMQSAADRANEILTEIRKNQPVEEPASGG